MCRIAGFFDTSVDVAYDRRAVLVAMRDALQHGGPDAAGEYFDMNDRLALGHRRLSILDLSERANQPMCSERSVLVFNGECYNFREIRAELDYPSGFCTDSDSEVILKGFESKGRDFVRRLRGMFSFALWDTKTKRLLLCRDRLGVKPLYWYLRDGLFMFASELKAFHAHPRFDKTINQPAISTYLSYGYIPSPFSIYKYVHKLKPGHFLSVDEMLEPKEEQYWSAQSVYKSTECLAGTEAEATDSLESELVDSLKLRMVSDVPVGIFLSGGVDSSLVTAILQKHSNTQLKTFTIGFQSQEFNEADRARQIAQHIGTNHYEYTCTENEFRSIVPRIPKIVDEPFGDTSIIPTCLVSKFAREHVKVSLSADGGDELFGGYTKYEFVKKWYPRLAYSPRTLRRLGKMISRQLYRVSAIGTLTRKSLGSKYSNIDAKILKILRSLDAKNMDELFDRASSYITPSELARLVTSIEICGPGKSFPHDKNRSISLFGLLDVLHYLEGDILTKVDRATMHVALEGRDPLLDHRLVEFGFSIPDHWKINQGTNKYLLRKVLDRYVPAGLCEHTKYGFAIPVSPWLKHNFKDQVLALSEDHAFMDTFGLVESELRTIVKSFLAGCDFRDPQLVWFLFVLYLWYQEWH